VNLWRNTPLDAIPIGLSLLQLATTLWGAYVWPEAGLMVRIAIAFVLFGGMLYAILIVGHQFTHAPWFRSPLLNAIAGLLISLNIAQSAQTYRLKHVRNHHRYNNDRPGPDGRVRDTSSTFADSADGDHVNVLRYAIVGALSTLGSEIGLRLSAHRLWRVTAREHALHALVAKGTLKGARELRQIQRERAALALAALTALLLRPEWCLLAYLPAMFAALVMVNVQNYYEHFGACPEDRFANSASHYGRAYNFFTFNDGYHQEHHLSPGSHWSAMKQVHRRYAARLDGHPRIVSPVPAILGFLDVRRARLDRMPKRAPNEAATP